MNKTHSPRRYLVFIVRVLGVLFLLGLVFTGVQLFNMASDLAEHSLHPPRSPLHRMPDAVGITNYQEVTFTASDGVAIRGWYMPGSNGSVIVLGHGNQGNRSDELDDAAILTSKGYGALLFDWRGEGQSGGDTVSFGEFEVRDLHAAVDFALAQPGVDPKKIGGLGFSLGASVMTLGAAQDDRIKAVIIEDTFTTLDDVAAWRTRDIPLLGPLAVQVGQKRAGVDASQVRPIDAICKISPRPVLLIYGAQDDYIPPGSADKMFAAACAPKDLWKVPGVGHGGFQQVVPDEYAARIAAFFDQNLLH